MYYYCVAHLITHGFSRQTAMKMFIGFQVTVLLCRVVSALGVISFLSLFIYFIIFSLEGLRGGSRCRIIIISEDREVIDREGRDSAAGAFSFPNATNMVQTLLRLQMR